LSVRMERVRLWERGRGVTPGSTEEIDPAQFEWQLAGAQVPGHLD
jgi:hypothetical protein